MPLTPVASIRQGNLCNTHAGVLACADLERRLREALERNSSYWLVSARQAGAAIWSAGFGKLGWSNV